MTGDAVRPPDPLDAPRVELTPEQKAAAFAAERSVAVVAGAGTGKTRVLTERYLHLVLERGATVPRVLAVTFTEKAAREMKDRIRQALKAAGRPGLARQAEFAPISTIHAFLARTLRERALDAGLDPRFAIADEMTAQLVLEEARAVALDGLDAATREALLDVDGGEEWLLALYLAARATPFAMGELRPVTGDAEAFRVDLERFLGDCDGAMGSGKTAERLAGLAVLAPRLRALDPDAAAEFSVLVKGNVAHAQRELFHEGKRLAAEYLPYGHAGRAARAGAAVVAALEAIDATYTRLKRADGLLDFSDLEREGLKLLRSPAGAAIAADYDHLLVDEYQDTSRIQQALLDVLAQRCERFGVGDEKQSIYRFRYADAAVFRELRGASATYPLSGSFRSRPEVVDFVNDLFRGLFAQGAVEPQDLRAELEWRPKDRCSVQVVAPVAENAAQGRRAEARALARHLRDTVEAGALRRTAAGAPDEPLRYRDCAILLRAMTGLLEYERALSDAGVPYVVWQGRGYYAAREVVDLAHLLLLLQDPHDTYRAVAAMTSLLCGVPDGDLLHLLHGQEGVPLPLRAGSTPRPEAIPPDRWERLRLFADRFRRWREQMGRLETGDFVEAILAETRFADLLLLESDGRRRYANLMKALRRARATADDPATYARTLLEFREREMRESEAPIAAEDDDAVKVMTVHAAKGLEFPLVAVADLGGQVGSRSGPLLAADGCFAFKLRHGFDDTIKPPGYAALGEVDKEQDRDERRRLLYVAFTRAQEHLVLSGARTERPGDVLAVLLQPRPDVEIVDPQALVVPDARRRRHAAVRAAVRAGRPLPPSVPRAAEAARGLLERVDAVQLPPEDATPYVAAVADLVEFARCPRRYRLRRMLGIEYDLDWEAGEPADAEEHPRRELGTAFHEVMAQIGPGAVPDAATVKRHFPQARAADVARIREWAEWLAGLDLVKRIGGAKTEPEMPFLTRVAGLAMRGVVDLYVPGLPMLLDYKTGAKVRAGEYGVQVAVYLEALRSLGRPAPDRAHLVYVDARQVVEVPDEPQTVTDLVRRFREAHMGDGAFPPTPTEACLHCEFRPACVANGVACPRDQRLF